MVPSVTVDDSTININRNIVTLTLSWGEPFNNLDPIVSYTVSCSGDVACPPNFTTTDNTTRNYTITNFTTMTNYIFSVVATNSIGSGKAGELNCTTPGEITVRTYVLGMGDNKNFMSQYVYVIGALFVHNKETQISPPFDSYINKLTVHVCMDANSSSVCFCCGCFLRCVRRP